MRGKYALVTSRFRFDEPEYFVHGVQYGTRTFRTAANALRELERLNRRCADANRAQGTCAMWRNLQVGAFDGDRFRPLTEDES